MEYKFNINDHVLIWDTEKKIVHEGWIRYLVSNNSDKEGIYFISFLNEYFPENISNENVYKMFDENYDKSIITRERFICQYNVEIEKKVNSYIAKYNKFKIIQEYTDIHKEVIQNIFKGKSPIGHFQVIVSEIKRTLIAILNWILKVLIEGTLWLILGSILRPYIAFNHKLKLQKELKNLKKDYHREKMIESLLKKENAVDSIDQKVKLLEEGIEENMQEIHDSSNSTIALLLSVISIIISIIAIS